MSSHENPRHQSLNDLQAQCAQETANFFFGLLEDAPSCFEIFRRAIVEKNEDAWGAVMEQYRGQVTRWVEHHPKYRLFSEEADYFVNRVFEKFWRRNLTPTEFSQFPNVKSLLGYIKTCVASVMTDYWRVQERKETEYLADLNQPLPQEGGNSVEREVEYLLQRRRFWHRLHTHLPDDIEYKVVYDSFAIGLKPVEIFNHSPDVFGNIQEVYKIKARAMSRLSRVAGLSSHFSDNSGEME